MGIWYEEERDGTLEEYVKYCGDNNIPKVFRSMEHFQKLWDTGYITPLITVVRIMYNTGRNDEHYIVVSENEIEGILLNAHSGKEGLHKVEDIMALVKKDEDLYWEIGPLNPSPEPRE